MRKRIRQSRAQRRALACVLLMQRRYLKATAAEREEMAPYMRELAIAADAIDAFTVYIHTNL